jgi:putative protease
MELLAPAGNIENFFAALNAGADAVYVGAPGFNARNLARDLSLEEIGAMVEYCHEKGKKIYIAANSLLLEKELPEVIDALGVLEYLQPDALIVQDLGLINLIRRFFPRIKMHASTLMAAHNLQGVELFARLGCERVVLARELTLAEIQAISARTDVELEVFVHGAMCFSYSGLCLFSSYLGGKSGLRGRCVQPCRRAYSSQVSGKKASGQGGRGNYLFSMNDLDGLDVLHELREAGVASFKIEGRLRSARYVEKVVEAYRMVLDAEPAGYDDALNQARLCVEQAMSRKVTSGYFFSPQPAEAISPFHSGNMGLHLGRAGGLMNVSGSQCLRLTLKEPLALGDRLRLHLEPAGERVAYSLKTILIKGQAEERGAAGQSVDIVLPAEASGKSWKHVDVYKVDVARVAGGSRQTGLQVAAAANGISSARRQMSRELQDVKWKAWEASHHLDDTAKATAPKTAGRKPYYGKKRGGPEKVPMEWWLKLDTAKPLLGKLPVKPERFIINLDRHTVKDAGELKRALGKQTRNVTWSLPPIMLDRELLRMKKHITTLIRSGFRCFQLGHLSQIDLFEGERVFLSADYSLNMINNQALLLATEAGFESGQLSIEADKESLTDAIQGYKQSGVPASQRSGGRRTMRLGLTVYGTPSLFTSRIAASFFQYERPVVSPKKENFVIRKRDGFTETHPQRPFSLLPYLQELKSLGLDFAVVDLTGGHSSKRDLEELAERMSGTGRQSKLSTFNYLGTLE